MNETEESISILYDRVSQKEYANGVKTCNDCGKNKPLFHYSKQRMLCVEYVLKTKETYAIPKSIIEKAERNLNAGNTGAALKQMIEIVNLVKETKKTNE